MRQTEGVANRDHPVADIERIGIAERKRGEVLVFDADDRDVGELVAPHDVRRDVSPVGELHLDLGGVLDDVVVGEHQTGLVVDEPGSEPFADHAAPPGGPHFFGEADDGHHTRISRPRQPRERQRDQRRRHLGACAPMRGMTGSDGGDSDPDRRRARRWNQHRALG